MFGFSEAGLLYIRRPGSGRPGLTHAASLGWLSVLSSQCKPREDVVWLLSFPALGLSQSVNVMRKYAAPRQPGLIETKRFLVSTETASGARFAWLGTGPVASTANQSCASCTRGAWLGCIQETKRVLTRSPTKNPYKHPNTK